jgi:micrococcal nuclease
LVALVCILALASLHEGDVSKFSSIPPAVEIIHDDAPASEVRMPAVFVDAQREYYSVVKVIDGDTLTIDMHGSLETLRLIGINTPETVDPRRPVECFGKEASAKAKATLLSARVHVEADASQDVRDKYGRMLVYVFLPDGTNFNKLMIADGYAYEYTYRLPYKYQAEFKEAERTARESSKGLWADGACGEKNISATPTPSSVIVATSTSGGYVCGKNTYNCSSFITQKEAQSAFDACGGSARDVHKLDSDKDGIVCEGLP